MRHNRKNNSDKAAVRASHLSSDTFASDAGPSELMQSLADSVTAMVAYFVRENYRCIFANKAYASNYGLDVLSIIGKTLPEIVGARDFAAIESYLDRAMLGETVYYERQIRLSDGSERTLEIELIPRCDDDGAVLAACVQITDITQHHDVEKALRENEERLQQFADATNEGIVLFVDSDFIADCNEAFARMMRMTPVQLVGRSIKNFIAPEDFETFVGSMRAGHERVCEVTLVRTDHSRLTVELLGKDIVYRDVPLRMTVLRDISERKQVEARVQFLADHDALTQLPNRALLLDHIKIILASARRNRTEVGILFIDLDNFKTINDSLGHKAGDEVLKHVASAVQACLRSVDLVGRLGGDEFLVVLADLANAEDIVPVVEKIAKAISEPLSLEDQFLSISGSIGISVFPRDGETADALIGNADDAMYLAKELGRNHWQFFQPSLNKKAFEALALETGIRKAIKERQFTLHFQPEVRTNTGRAATMAALIRWQHPELGLLGPEQFISVAEHRGLIMPIGRWVIDEAIRQACEWADSGIAIPIAINLSAIQFKQKNLVEEIAARLNEHCISGEMLELELTGSLFLQDDDAITKTLGRLKDLGVTLAVGNFGSGNFSLSCLKQYPIDKVKIDRSFVRGIPHRDNDVAITIAILNLAASLDLRVVAEGVESVSQAHFLEDHQCDFLQGNHISQPLDATESLEWLKHRFA